MLSFKKCQFARRKGIQFLTKNNKKIQKIKKIKKMKDQKNLGHSFFKFC